MKLRQFTIFMMQTPFIVRRLRLMLSAVGSETGNDDAFA